MRLVATRRLEIGARLARDVPAPRGAAVPLLRAGVAVTAGQRQALLAAGINAVYVDDALGADIDVPEALSAETRREARTTLSRVLAEAPQALSAGRPLPDRAVSQLERVAERIADEVASSGEAALALSDLAAADAYTMEHSIDVTVVGLLIGHRLFRQHGRVDFRGGRSFDRIGVHLSQLGVGLMLHDIGKLAIPSSILQKPGPLDAEEWALMRRHPLIGVEMLAGDAIGARAKSVVRSHHERWDGAGYPQRLAGAEISQFARIASVADVFDAVTSERPYATAAPQHVGVAIVREGSGSAFEPEVAAVFGEVVAPYPPGSEIVLADGREGIVVSVHEARLDLPLVRVWRESGRKPVAPYELDLAERPELAPGGAPGGASISGDGVARAGERAAAGVAGDAGA